MLRRFAITLLVTALPVVGLAQTSVYSSMTLAGSFQGWNPGANNMTLVSNNTWRATLFAQRGAQEYFKFAANRSWDINWGQSAILSPPVTNVAILTAADIAISFPQDGYYRFTFNDQTLIYSIILDSVSLPWTNRTRNGSFELEGSEETKPLHWENGFPDGMGDLWGNVGRADWRALTGSSIAYIGAGDWDYGGFWQDIPAGRGFTYELTANFWADAEPPYGPWTADNKELKIEFFGSGFSGPLAVYATPLDGLTSDWTEFKVIGEAPEGTMYARSVISVSGAGDLGSLQFDDVSIREIPPMAQSFSWPFAFTPGRYSYAGWLMTTGSVTDEARTGLAASLPQGGQIVSPLTTSGVGRVNFFYRHENTTDPEDNLEPITFRVQTSPNGSSWTTKGTVSNIVAQSYQSYSLYLADPDVRYVRVDHLSGTNNLLIDDIQLADATDDPRLQDFEGAGWTNTSDTIITINDWLLSLGRITTNEAYSGTSGVIGDPLVPTNVFTWQLRSPYYSDGYGTISFQYARGTNGYGPASLRLQESPDGSNTWTDLAVIEPIISGSYIQYNQFFYEPNPRYIRIVNQQIDAGAIDNVLIQEPFTEGSEAPGGWLFDGVGEYTSDSSSGESPNSVKFDTTGDTITTPVLNHPTNLTFWMKGNGISGSSFLIETTTDGSLWTTLVNLTSLSNTESSPSYSLSTNVIQIRFTYTKVSGNLAFDDVYIVGVATGETGPQELLIDDFSISKPVAYRNQNFETWPRKGSYTSGTDEWEGWSVQEVIVDPEEGYEGQVGRMNRNTQSIIQSHLFPDGAGNISFQYKLWSTDTNNTAAVEIQTSINGSSWTSIDTLSITNDSGYLYYSKYNFITNGVYVRLYKNGGGRVLFDNILIDTPKPPADVVINAEIDPPAPFTNDAVYLDAIVLPANGAETTNVTAYYRIGTSGGFTTLAMTNTGYITYRSATNIPAQPAGTIVQYYFKVEFSGPGSELNSPAYYPDTAPGVPGSYGIPRSEPGQVWINEVDYNDAFNSWGFAFTPAFIELAGIAGFDLSDWSIAIYHEITLISRYTITNNTTLLNESGGYGFWVLGNELLPDASDQMFTNLLWDIPTGIQLLNEVGGVEDSIMFGGVASGFELVSKIDIEPAGTNGVALIGTGTNRDDFAWAFDTNIVFSTPGAVNMGQIFGDLIVPEAYITALIMKTNVQFTVVGNPDNWTVQPMITTNLMANPVAWTMVTPFNEQWTGGTNQVWFNFPTGVTNPIYSIRLTAP